LPELPVVSGQEARRAFERLGWTFRRQVGSHMILTKPGSIASRSIPNHRELAPGMLHKLIHLAGVSFEEFRAVLA